MNISKKSDIPHQHEIGKMAKGTVLVGAGDVIGNVFFYLLSVIITRSIGAYLYGLYFLGNVVLQIGSMVSRFGLDFAILKFVALYKGQNDQTRMAQTINTSLFLTVIFSSIFAALLFFSAPWLSNTVFHKPLLIPVFKFFALSLPFVNVTLLIINAFLSLQVPKFKVFIENLAQPLLKLIFIVVLFLFGFKLMGVVVGTAISSIFIALISWYLLFKQFPAIKSNSLLDKKKQLFSFATPVYGENLLNYLINWVDILLLGYLATSKEVGIFGIIFRLTMVLVFVQYSFNAIFSPMISELYGQNKITKLEQLFKLQTRWAITLTLPMLFLILLYPASLLKIFGKYFDEGAIALSIMCVGRFFDVGIGASGLMIMMTGKPKLNTVNSFITLILKVTLNLFLIPRYGLIGAAISSSFSVIILDLLRVIEVYITLKIHPYDKKLIKSFLAISVGTILHFTLQSISGTNLAKININIISVISLLFAYFLVLFSFKLDNEDKYILKRLYQKITLLQKKK